MRTELQQGLLHIQADLGKTIVFVTHDVDEAFLLGDEVLVLRREAQVAQRGRPDDILLHPIDDFVSSFIGGDRRNLHMERHDDHPPSLMPVVDSWGVSPTNHRQPSGRIREHPMD
ncbi:L-proline glycine betaine ABC transport system permease protein ProV [Cutibacterium acnes JCM 18920]|nr:L-proline glycine betaine ABC transport system permease protein ProV [Cutibacterium acnes JCM 18920]